MQPRISNEWLDKMEREWKDKSLNTPNDIEKRDVWNALLDLQDLRDRVKGMSK